MASLVNWGSQRLFDLVHQKNLVYNQCWEDPRLDREAMNLTPEDEVLMITSAGCNALDYAIESPKSIYCVDVNPAQTALIELKIAGIRNLDYDLFFDIFGKGYYPGFDQVYKEKLRPFLSMESRKFWDGKKEYFTEGSGFYFRGTSGRFARGMYYYLGFKKMRDLGYQLFASQSIQEQKEIYDRYVKDLIWNKSVDWIMSWDASLAMLGVPRPQRQQIDKTYSGGIVEFAKDCIEYVFTKLPLHDNYFWWLYFHGSYSESRCPRYLQENHFNELKAGKVDVIKPQTTSILDFLNNFSGQISKYVLLDHMDWLSYKKYPVLVQEWQAMINRACDSAQFLWRTAGTRCDFIDPIEVAYQGVYAQLGELLNYNKDLAQSLHKKDRVHTYGNFFIGQLA